MNDEPLPEQPKPPKASALAKVEILGPGLECPLCRQTIEGRSVTLLGKCAQHGALVPVAVICARHIAPAWLFRVARQNQIAGQTALFEIAVRDAERTGRKMPSLRVATIRRPLARPVVYRQTPIVVQRLRRLAELVRRAWHRWLKFSSCQSSALSSQQDQD